MSCYRWGDDGKHGGAEGIHDAGTTRRGIEKTEGRKNNALLDHVYSRHKDAFVCLLVRPCVCVCVRACVCVCVLACLRACVCDANGLKSNPYSY